MLSGGNVGEQLLARNESAETLEKRRGGAEEEDPVLDKGPVAKRQRNRGRIVVGIIDENALNNRKCKARKGQDAAEEVKKSCEGGVDPRRNEGDVVVSEVPPKEREEEDKQERRAAEEAFEVDVGARGRNCSLRRCPLRS